MTMEMPLPLTKKKDSFVLKLSKEMYRDNIVQKALAEDKEWVAETSVSDECYCFEFKTTDIEDVFDWMNYLIYLHKGSL